MIGAKILFANPRINKSIAMLKIKLTVCTNNYFIPWFIGNAINIIEHVAVFLSDQGNEWRLGRFTVHTGYETDTPFALDLYAGNGPNGNIAIDDITLEIGSCDDIYNVPTVAVNADDVISDDDDNTDGGKILYATVLIISTAMSYELRNNCLSYFTTRRMCVWCVR